MVSKGQKWTKCKYCQDGTETFLSGSADEKVPSGQTVSFNSVYIWGLSLGTSDILGQKILHGGTDLCTVGCLAAPMASTH